MQADTQNSVWSLAMEVYESTRGRIVRAGESGGYRMEHDGCEANTQYDWGKDFTQRIVDESIVMVQFKNGRNAYYLNSNMLELRRGDLVAVSSSPGHDVGAVALTGWLAQRSWRRCAEGDQGVVAEIYRKATQGDVERWLSNIAREFPSMVRAREVALELGLGMKIADVEFQADGAKASFFYSAEKRVDFRELVRMLATEFHIRVEMRQIGPRQEAGRLGGLGTCGQTLCCACWMHQFAPVTTSTVKMQDLTPNPLKQAGQCGKLKCCLNFEVDVYADAKQKLPKLKGPLRLEGQDLYHVKNDLFRDYMWFSTEPRGAGQMVMLTLKQVHDVLALNAEGKEGAALTMFIKPKREERVVALDYDHVIEEESITRFDKPKNANRNRKRPNRGSTNGRQEGLRAQNGQGRSSQPQANKSPNQQQAQQGEAGKRAAGGGGNSQRRGNFANGNRPVSRANGQQTSNRQGEKGRESTSGGQHGSKEQ